MYMKDLIHILGEEAMIYGRSHKEKRRIRRQAYCQIQKNFTGCGTGGT